MNMIVDLLERKGIARKTWPANDDHRFSSFLQNDILKAYFESCLPTEIYLASGVRVLPREQIIEEITEYTPGKYIFPYGFLPIATSLGGNALCVDTQANLWWADHDFFLETGIVFLDQNTKQLIEREIYTIQNVQSALRLVSSEFTRFFYQLVDGNLPFYLDSFDS